MAESLNFTLTDYDKKLLLQTARETILSALEKREPQYKEATKILNENCGAFVTLHKKGNLRGCIGYLSGIKPLFDTIKDMADSSAFNDPRFHPVEISEINDITIEISVLSPMVKINDISELEPGKHGLYLKKGLFFGNTSSPGCFRTGMGQGNICTLYMYKSRTSD